MLKCCIRPLVTLVLALVATGVLSTLCPAREFRSPDGSPAVRATDSAKPRPVALSGEPDQPLSPPPVRVNSGVLAPLVPDGNGGGVPVDVFRWISWIWASWLARAAL